ncbi:MAG: exonuclease, partial [Chloroflexi bacterium]|nr:exonuclease [Chloroflexota bacterium]
LQDQLFEKDVPDLVAAMGYSIRTAVLKGRSNYLCLQRWLSLLRGDAFREEEATLLTKTLLWISQTSTGDRSELRLMPEEESAWLRVCSQAESCSPRTCPYHREGTCFVVRARRAAEASHIVIVNHALLISDVVASSRIIPDYDQLVVDEAHHLEEEATAQLSSSVGLRTFTQPLDALVGFAARQQIGSLHLALALLRGANVAERRLAQLMEQVDMANRGAIEAVRHVGDLFEAVRELLGARAARGELVPTCRLTPSARRESAWLVVEQTWAAARSALHTILRGIRPLIEDVEDAATAGHQEAAELLAELLRAVHELEEAMEATQAIVEKPSGDSVCWASELNGVVTLHLAPLDVAPHIRRWLLDPKTTVVFTSATLSTEGSFEYVRDRLGVDDAEELALGSPFDYRRAALLFVPTDLPEPTQPGYARPAAEAIADVAEAMGGRTLALFTSYAQLRTTRDMIRDRMERAEIVLMSQGIDGSRTRLLQRFKDTERALLLGTASFWEGVDVVGGALSALLIARLPFAVPTDPVFAARSEQFEDPFHQYTVPQAILRLKQGFGRLIRSKTDRGIVVILDRRIVTKTYGPAFLNSLPPCTLRVAPVATAGPAASDWVTMPITLDASTSPSTTPTVPGS